MFSVKRANPSNYEFPKQPFIVKKYQYNFSCSLHLYIKQNGTCLLLFWCLVSSFQEKLAYNLGEDGSKTDNWLKLN